MRVGGSLLWFHYRIGNQRCVVSFGLRKLELMLASIHSKSLVLCTWWRAIRSVDGVPESEWETQE